jgi:hypothetical protein
MLLKSIEGYRLNIRSAVRSLWNGNIDYYTFMDNMSLAIERGFTQAWYEGAKIYGVSPSELTDEEHLRLTDEVNREREFVRNLGQAINTNSKVFGGKLQPLLTRSELWVSGYNRIRILGSSYAAKDQKLQFNLGFSKEHCVDCTRYNGRVYRASIWRKYDIQPRSYSLACRGYHCLCFFTPTNAPATPGFPPGPLGR